jgi:hypothetical protein
MWAFPEAEISESQIDAYLRHVLMNSVEDWAVSDLPSFHAHQIAESRCGCGKSKLQSVQPFIDNKVQVFDIGKTSVCL